MTTEQKDTVGVGRGGRMSRQRKRDAVLRLLRGEDLDTVSRSLGVTAATLSGWRDASSTAAKPAWRPSPWTARSARATASRRASARCCSSASCSSRKLPCWRATAALWPAGGGGDEPHAVAEQRQALRPRTRLPDLAQCESECLSAPPSEARAAEAGTHRPDAGCGAAGTDPRCPCRQPLPRRRPPEGLGPVADRRHPR